MKLVTVRETKNNDEQQKGLSILKESLKNHNIQFEVEYSEHMHDRQVIIGNGYIIKIGRGLNYFKGPPNKYSIGAFDHNYRQCRQTNIDVFYCPENNKKD
jgi:hypothetical protein